MNLYNPIQHDFCQLASIQTQPWFIQPSYHLGRLLVFNSLGNSPSISKSTCFYTYYSPTTIATTTTPNTMPVLSSKSFVLAQFSLLVANAQLPGELGIEFHPPLPLTVCTAPGVCEAQEKSAVLDQNWRWLHKQGGFTPCENNAAWKCGKEGTDNPIDCAKSCVLEAVDKKKLNDDYGVSIESVPSVLEDGVQEDALRLSFYSANKKGPDGKTPAPDYTPTRFYMMNSANADGDDEEYELLKLKNKEFTFTVDVSTLTCGLNGALYLVEMSATGNKGETNTAGAKFGTGYCDAQCPIDMKFVDGQANNYSGNGSGKILGSCCGEMDIWEANKVGR